MEARPGRGSFRGAVGLSSSGRAGRAAVV